MERKQGAVRKTYNTLGISRAFLRRQKASWAARNCNWGAKEGGLAGIGNTEVWVILKCYIPGGIVFSNTLQTKALTEPCCSLP